MQADESTYLLITGASSGIGAATARRLAGTRPLVLTARRAERLETLRNELDGPVAIVPGAIEASSTIAACIDAADGRLGGVIANAGVMPIAPVSSAALDDWRRTVDVNLTGVLHLTHAALQAMPDGGDVMFVSSVAGRTPFPGAAVYSATKAAINSFADALRGETAAATARGGPAIRVTTVLPGAVDTELTDSINDEAVRAGTRDYYDRLPHLLTPDDIAEAIAWVLDRPGHVSVNELVIRPTGMAR